MPSTLEALLVIVLFILPGFILASVYNRNISRPTPSDARLAITSIAFSAFSHLTVYVWTSRIYRWYLGKTLFAEHIHSFALWVLIVIFLLPILYGWLFSTIVEARPLQGFLRKINLSLVSRTTQAWDYFFQQKEGCWVIVHLKSSAKVGGRFGQNSFASLTPYPKDVYIEEVYEISDDNTFGDPFGDSFGMWISGDEIERIEFFKVQSSEEGEIHG